MALLWLRYRPAAVALIHPLAWEPPRAVGLAFKRGKKKNLWSPKQYACKGSITTGWGKTILETVGGISFYPIFEKLLFVI